MKTANQILASNPSQKQLTRLIDKRMDAITRLLQDLQHYVAETAELASQAGFDAYEMRNELQPLLIKAESLARKL